MAAHAAAEQYASGEDVPMDSDAARLRRDKASYRGIGKPTALRELAASSVNQDFLDEIGQLTGLEYLELGYPVTATDLKPLTALKSLHLTLDSPRAIAEGAVGLWPDNNIANLFTGVTNPAGVASAPSHKLQ
jgi:hypothetical protein